MTHRAIVDAAVAELGRRVAVSHADLRPVAGHFEVAVHQACLRWGLTAERWFDGGAETPTLLVRRRDGSDGVLKIALPGDLDAAVAVMRAADGRGYARVLDWNADLGAVVVERLGTDLWQSERTVAGQVSVILPLLREVWTVPLECGSPYVGKATGLLGILRGLGTRYGSAHSDALGRATAYARSLAATEEPEVVCHGDPHAGNVLRRSTGWALIDPDGFVGERAYDCGVAVRDACPEIASAERDAPGSGRTLLRRACRLAGDLGGVDEDRIWRWGYVERVTTGLYLHWLGQPHQGELFLSTASALLDDGSD